MEARAGNYQSKEIFNLHLQESPHQPQLPATSVQYRECKTGLLPGDETHGSVYNDTGQLIVLQPGCLIFTYNDLGAESPPAIYLYKSKIAEMLIQLGDGYTIFFAKLILRDYKGES